MTSTKLYACAVFAALTATATPFVFSTGNVTSSMAMASRPSSPGRIEIEAADDFVLISPTLINKATFTGLLASAGVSDITQVRTEIYRVFPQDSNTGRTSGPPTFSTSKVVTRANSPSDDALLSRDAPADFSFAVEDLGAFTASNSVLNGINLFPNQRTGGEGPVDGTEILVSLAFTNPILLPAGHYFFVPQVAVGTGQFYWLSGTRPILPPGKPFMPDLQAWIRNETLAPDWSRVGTDIVGGSPAPTFNGAFTLDGVFVPEPSTVPLVAFGALALAALRRRA